MARERISTPDLVARNAELIGEWPTERVVGWVIVYQAEVATIEAQLADATGTQEARLRDQLELARAEVMAGEQVLATRPPGEVAAAERTIADRQAGRDLPPRP